MPKSRKAKPPRGKSKPAKPKSTMNGEALSGWAIEAKPVEPMRLRSISPTLWRDSLKRLREDFLSARTQHGRFAARCFRIARARPTLSNHHLTYTWATWAFALRSITTSDNM